MQRLDASTSPVGVTTIRRIKLDANESLDGSMQPRRLDDHHMFSAQSVHIRPFFADSDLTMRTKGTLLMKMVGDFVS